MQSSSSPESKSKNTATRTGSNVTVVLRWVVFLPVAFLASRIGYSLGAVFLFLRDPVYPAFLFPLLLLVPSGFAFVFAGALVAPRYKLVVAVCLATVSAILSLLIHVLTQPNPGIVNYMNSTGEFLGGLLAVAVIMVLKLIRREK